MRIEQEISTGLAEILMRDFAEETGLSGSAEPGQHRYLWTDALAVQNFLALAEDLDEKAYADLAKELIEKVHFTLGKFSHEDPRSGWISGLSDEEGRKHPAIRGLRIGKKQLERKRREAFNSHKEWKRDGQYFHYHTRWIQALLHAAEFLENHELKRHAAELSLAGKYFINKINDSLHLFWKMSVNLSHPQVLSMGAHDPLDGYLTAQECNILTPDDYDFTDYLKYLKCLCEEKNWESTDPLGLGGLSRNIVRSVELDRQVALPESVKPQKLFQDLYRGLGTFASQSELDSPAEYRLAFRECGLSLGLRIIDGYRDKLAENGLDVNRLDEILPMAETIEDFWSETENREHASYRDHRFINDVTLASSLLARRVPKCFGVPEIK